MNEFREFYQHFSRIARHYRRLRTTDFPPVNYIARKLARHATVHAADVGCGAGRYDRMLCSLLGPRLHLLCVDQNVNMLGELTRHLQRHHCPCHVPVQAQAGHLPIATDALNAVFTFNAIHHFPVLPFFQETARLLKKSGYLFVYTRLRSQNQRNVWGRFFPGFAEKENRLFELDELLQLLAAVSGLQHATVKRFKFPRFARMRWLVMRARQHHYSTFCFYTATEFEQALREFQENLQRHYRDPDHITWYDENLLLIAKKAA